MFEAIALVCVLNTSDPRGYRCDTQRGGLYFSLAECRRKLYRWRWEEIDVRREKMILSDCVNRGTK